MSIQSQGENFKRASLAPGCTSPGRTGASAIRVHHAGTRKFDPNHTLVEFSVKHMMITTVKGHFKSVRGTIVFDEADASRSWVEVEIDTASLDSGIEMRDIHLKSADFLDSKMYPTITFKSSSVEPQGEDHACVIGNLTIRGITREVVLDTEVTGRGKGPGGKETIGFEARTQISRSDFGMTLHTVLESGGVLVDDIVKIEIAVAAQQRSV